ncbi:hypothetical protein E2I00_002973 [Balaenoptera physalus]|uniref:Uncharacterized protein n=1 Tax=Balaenoptera physalus TaxID=9770 RepID=A0A6A1Q4W7_BALPH|nr:hypothetical protein E2I00_002973 [Balaenoptera physalus]
MQLSMLMYTPPSGQPWGGENPVDLAFRTICFCWHLALGAAIYGLCSLRHDRFSSWRKAPGAKYHLCPIGEGSEELEKLRAGAQLRDGGV